jgi:hypothetical protein
MNYNGLDKFCCSKGVRLLAVFSSVDSKRFCCFDGVVDLEFVGVKIISADITSVLNSAVKLLNDAAKSLGVSNEVAIEHRVTLVLNESEGHFGAFGLICLRGETSYDKVFNDLVSEFIEYILPDGVLGLMDCPKNTFSNDVKNIVTEHANKFLSKHNRKNIKLPFKIATENGLAMCDSNFDCSLDQPKQGNVIEGEAIVDSTSSADIIMKSGDKLKILFEPDTYRESLICSLYDKKPIYVRLQQTRNNGHGKFANYLESYQRDGGELLFNEEFRLRSH